MAKLTSTESLFSTGVLHDIFEAGGLLKHSIRDGENMLRLSERRSGPAKEICEEIKFRNFNFYNVDVALARLADASYFSPLHDSATKKPLTTNQLANILAAFCAEQEIFWDDVNTRRTTTEMETYVRGVFGKACWKFRCFLSQQAGRKAATAGTASTTGIASTTGAGGTRRSRGSSDYKVSGPKSSLIKGLVGKPGEKITFSPGNTMYVVICKSSKAKKQYLFVDPLAHRADPNKIRLGDPSGNSACKLLFTSRADAEAAIERITTGGFVIPEHIIGFTVERQTTDANGYFKINTEIGAAYIKASKLNEEIEESLSEESTEARTSRFPVIEDIDVYSDAVHRYE